MGSFYLKILRLFGNTVHVNDGDLPPTPAIPPPSPYNNGDNL